MIKIGKNLSEFSVYSCQPKTRDELKDIIGDRILKEGPNCDLNDIDTSLIDDMSGLFIRSDFNGDISNWDVSNVMSMRGMFSDCNKLKSFGDISSWDVSKVTNMAFMFCNCESFNKDVSKWNVSKVRYNSYMFDSCPIKDEYKPKFK